MHTRSLIKSARRAKVSSTAQPELRVRLMLTHRRTAAAHTQALLDAKKKEEGVATKQAQEAKKAEQAKIAEAAKALEDAEAVRKAKIRQLTPEEIQHISQYLLHLNQGGPPVPEYRELHAHAHAQRKATAYNLTAAFATAAQSDCLRNGMLRGGPTPSSWRTSKACSSLRSTAPSKRLPTSQRRMRLLKRKPRRTPTRLLRCGQRRKSDRLKRRRRLCRYPRQPMEELPALHQGLHRMAVLA